MYLFGTTFGSASKSPQNTVTRRLTRFRMSENKIVLSLNYVRYNINGKNRRASLEYYLNPLK